MGIGISFVFQGNFDKARTYLEQSLKLAKEEGHYGWIYTDLGTLVELHRKRGDLDAAMAYAEEALKVAPLYTNSFMGTWFFGEPCLPFGSKR
jgi:tetratricopeptide (TPR) repeat protein